MNSTIQLTTRNCDLNAVSLRILVFFTLFCSHITTPNFQFSSIKIHMKNWSSTLILLHTDSQTSILYPQKTRHKSQIFPFEKINPKCHRSDVYGTIINFEVSLPGNATRVVAQCVHGSPCLLSLLCSSDFLAHSRTLSGNFPHF